MATQPARWTPSLGQQKGLRGNCLSPQNSLPVDAIPREFGSGSTCYRRFVEWTNAEVFEKIHAEALYYYHEKCGLDLEWASLDSASVKAPKGGTSRVPIPLIAENSAASATF